jgi:hypothetical protein
MQSSLLHTGSRRLFSSSSSLRVVGPESPKWLPVPELRQPQRIVKKVVKGSLPVPRKIVPKERVFKAAPGYLSQSAPEPLVDREITVDKMGTAAGRVTWKKLMAARRRSMLRQGMNELMHREFARDESVKKRKAQRVNTAIQAQTAPERLEDELTAQSVPLQIRELMAGKGWCEPETPEETAKRKADHDLRLQRKEERRASQVHELYMHARKFITTDEQLSNEIETVFGPDSRPVTWGTSKSIWGIGKPMATTDMLQAHDQGTGVSRRDLVTVKDNAVDQRTLQRYVKMAAELTGASIPIPDELKEDPGTVFSRPRSR